MKYKINYTGDSSGKIEINKSLDLNETKDILKAYLQISVDYFDKLGIKDWWLESGTLLGFWRDKKIMDHDHDIDLGILLTEDILNKIKSNIHLLPDNISLYDTTSRHPCQKMGIKGLGKNCDWIFNKDENNKLFKCLNSYWKTAPDPNKEDIYPLTKIYFSDVDRHLNMPNKIEKYLKSKYNYLGRDYTGPDINGHYHKK